MNILQYLPELEGEEMAYVQSLTKDFNPESIQQFANIYRSRRKDPQTILIVTLIGFLGINGIQRFMLDQIGMGLLYLFTGGLCIIGTIIDLVNYKKLATEFNQKEAYNTATMVRNMTSSAPVQSAPGQPEPPQNPQV